jgi:hypothetical protein
VKASTRKLAAALKEVSPALCEDINFVLAQGGDLHDIQRITLQAKRAAGGTVTQETLVDAMIEAYTEAELTRRRQDG